MKLTVENILRQILRIGGISCAALACVLDGGLNVTIAADSQSSFVADADVIKPHQIVTNPSVSLIRAVGMNLLGYVGNLFIFLLTGGLFAAKPAVIGIS